MKLTNDMHFKVKCGKLCPTFLQNGKASLSSFSMASVSSHRQKQLFLSICLFYFIYFLLSPDKTRQQAHAITDTYIFF